MPENPKLKNLMDVTLKKVKDDSPLIFSHFKKLQIMPEGAFSQIFIALGLYSCPLELACQIFDLFLLEGERVIQRLVINSLRYNEKKILRMRDDGELYFYLTRDMINSAISEKGLRGILMEI